MNDQPSAPQIRREARLQFVPLDRMRVNPLAQRDFKPAWAAHLAARFDLEEMGNPTVNHRDGWFNIVDGQHRVDALKQWLDDWHGQEVECWTYEGLTDEQEAEKYLKLQDRLRSNAFDEFRIAVAAGRPDESEIERIIRDLGLTVSRYKRGLSATATLKKVYARGGPDVLERTLRIIRDAYGDTGFDGAVIDGLGLFCQRYNGEAREDRVVQRLSTAHGGVSGLLTRSTQLRQTTGGTKPQCVAAAIVETVNRGQGGLKLPSWWKADRAEQNGDGTP
jgi:hypothetical protein